MPTTTQIKEVSKEGLDFLAKEEGCILHPYRDSIGVATIGIGNTYYEDGQRVKITDPAITMERAYQLFKNILSHYEIAVWSITRDDITQNNFNALVSLCYNIGIGNFKISTVLKRVNANPKNPLIADGFKMWQNAGAKKGILLDRRIREAKLYFSNS